MTIFFSDLEGFTSLAERLPPEKVTELLQVYLSAMAGVVRECGGHVDKFMGDALMAFWGAPVRQPRHAARACEAALRMRTVLLERQEEWRVEYGCRLTFRAGLCSGEVLVGDLGSATKSSYSVLGKPVNLASRLERDARRWGSFLVVGEETQKEAGEDFLFRELDRLRLPGREAPWSAYELMASRGAEPSRLVQLLIVWGDALHAYYRRDFPAAQALFQRCLDEFQDEPAAVYVERCRTLQGRTLPEDWDGVFPEDLLQAPPAALLRQHASGTW
jgi:adenylate cyclase